MDLYGAIFDMDGTVVDSMKMWRTLGARYLESMGRKPQPGANEQFSIMHLEDIVRMLHEVYDLDIPDDEIIDGMYAIAGEYYMNEISYKPGVERVLDELATAGVRMCIATATNRTVCEPGLKKLGADKYFEKVFSCDEVGADKNSPLIYRAAMDFMGGTRENTVVFEDHPNCAKTAFEDGFKVIGIYDEYTLRGRETGLIDRVFSLYMPTYDEWPGLDGLKF